jgi:hypothetical protein
VAQYKAAAKEISNSDNTFLNGMEQSVSIKLKIVSIDNSGNVKAEISRFGRTGLLKGTISDDRELRLQGFIVGGNIEEQITLTATLNDKSLSDGKYSLSYSGLKITGTFNLALLDDD